MNEILIKMSIFREIPPTAGFPLYTKDIFALLTKQPQRGALEKDLREYLGTPYAQVVYSGTTAFYFILESLKNLSSKKTVIIPAFICPLIPLAIKRAGLRILACDTNRDNFDFNLEQLESLCKENPDILAIMPTHLGGIPMHLEQIRNITQKNQIFIIEDCAQSLGASYKNKKVGTIGDFSFFSLCRGKGLTIYEGGVIATKEANSNALIEKTINRFASKDWFSETVKILETFGYWIFYRPLLFWFVFRLPQIFWIWRKQPIRAASEYYTTDFSTHQISTLRKNLGHFTFGRLEEAINKQRQKVNSYAELLKGVSGIKLITEDKDSRASYPYLTLLFDEPSKRDKALSAFNGSGLGVSQIYLSAITDYPYLKDMIQYKNVSNARALAKRHISLTTSEFLKKADLNRIVEIISKI